MRCPVVRSTVAQLLLLLLVVRWWLLRCSFVVRSFVGVDRSQMSCSFVVTFTVPQFCSWFPAVPRPVPSHEVPRFHEVPSVRPGAVPSYELFVVMSYPVLPSCPVQFCPSSQLPRFCPVPPRFPVLPSSDQFQVPVGPSCWVVRSLSSSV